MKYQFSPNILNWNVFLSQRKRHSSSDLFNAFITSGNWTTCACGQMCKNLPRYDDKSPRDSILRKRGFRFNTLIRKMYYSTNYITYTTYRLQAKRVLDMIENRSSFLIRNL